MVIRDIYAAFPTIRQTGCAIVIVEQDIAFVLSLVDRMYFVDHGEIAREIHRGSDVDHQEIMDMYFGERAAS